MIYDYRCPNCRGSFSVPLGMTCSDHHPEKMYPVAIPVRHLEIDPWRALAYAVVTFEDSHKLPGHGHDGEWEFEPVPDDVAVTHVMATYTPSTCAVVS